MDSVNKARIERDNRIELNGERRKWVCCPYCDNHAFYIWNSTRIDNLPFMCKKCKKEFLIDT